MGNRSVPQMGLQQVEVVFDCAVVFDAMMTDYSARWLSSLVELVFHKLLASQGHRQNFEGVSFSTKVPKCVQCCFYIKWEILSSCSALVGQ